MQPKLNKRCGMIMKFHNLVPRITVYTLLFKYSKIVLLDLVQVTMSALLTH